MKNKIEEVFKNNICLLTNIDEEDYEDEYVWEIKEIADLLNWVFNDRYAYRFTKEQKIGIIKYECLACWHKLVDENIYEKIYSEIFN